MSRSRVPVGRSVLRSVAGRLRPGGSLSRSDLADIQGNVLRAYDNDHAAFLLVAVDDAAAGRRLLRDLVPDVTPASEWVVPPPVTTNVALTAAGLSCLGLSDRQLDTFPVAFRDGMAGRAAFLGDEGPADPDTWEPGLRDDTAHVMVLLTAWRGDRLDERVEQLVERIDADDRLRLVHRQRAERFEDRREHFGFLDGVAQPRLAGVDPPGTPPMGTPLKTHWQPLPVGEFLLGHRDAEGLRSPVPAGGWGRNGSFVVVRKLYQDVAAFRSLVREAGSAFPGGPDLLAAKLVGRWPDGTPLAASPDAPDPELAADPARINDFHFRDDPHGERCPVGAHIRRVNPRDGMGIGGSMTTRHRIIRRGVPYGPRLADGGGTTATIDDGQDRGLVFVCFAADIERQFEFIQRRWVNDGDVLGLGRDVDPLLGQPGRHGRFKVPGAPPFLLPLDQPLVRLRGGAYLFQPGVAALTALAAGAL